MSRRLREGAVLLVVLLLTACGPPTSGTEVVDPADVPYRLLEEDPDDPASQGAETIGWSGPLVYWLGEEDRLVPRRAAEPCLDQTEDQLGQMLAELAAGPGVDARDAGLGTAFPPGSGIKLSGVEDGLAMVDLEPGSTISADLLPAAVAQIVLTATSVRSVDQVELTSGGRAIQAPVPGGALATAPVRAVDYLSLVPPRLRGSDQFLPDGGASEDRPCRS